MKAIYGLALVLFALPLASAHQVDSVGEYRIEISWMQDPAISATPNGIYLYISPLDPALAPEDQSFENGISGLHKELKAQLVLQGETISLPLRPVSGTPGKYYALVEPTVPGYYQLNILGDINGTPINLGLHPPKVENREFIAFPKPSDDPVHDPISDILEQQDKIKQEISQIQTILQRIESSGFDPVGYVGIGIGIAAIALAILLFRRT